MNGRFPSAGIMTALAMGGLGLGAFLIGKGYQGKRPGILIPQHSNRRWQTSQIWVVHTQGRLPLRSGPPKQENGQWKQAHCLAVLGIGTRVHQVASDSAGGNPWFLVRVGEGPLTGVMGWVDARYLCAPKG